MIIMMIASLVLVLLMIFFRADEENELPLLQARANDSEASSG